MRRLERSFARLKDREIKNHEVKSRKVKSSWPAAEGLRQAGDRHPPTPEILRLVDRLEQAPRAARLRLLTQDRRCRQPAFLHPFLQRLDSQADLKPRDTAALVLTLACEQIPRLESLSEQRRLLCLAAGIWATAYHRLGHSAVAARVLRRALEMSRQYHAAMTTAFLLEKAARLAADLDHVDDALRMLEEAQITYCDHAQQDPMRRVLLARGRLLQSQGKNARIVMQAWRRLTARP